MQSSSDFSRLAAYLVIGEPSCWTSICGGEVSADFFLARGGPVPVLEVRAHETGGSVARRTQRPISQGARRPDHAESVLVGKDEGGGGFVAEAGSRTQRDRPGRGGRRR